MDFGIHRKIGIVTVGDRGIGVRIAEAFSYEGAKVLIVDINLKNVGKEKYFHMR